MHLEVKGSMMDKSVCEFHINIMCISIMNIGGGFTSMKSETVPLSKYRALKVIKNQVKVLKFLFFFSSDFIFRFQS